MSIIKKKKKKKKKKKNKKKKKKKKKKNLNYIKLIIENTPINNYLFDNKFD